MVNAVDTKCLAVCCFRCGFCAVWWLFVDDNEEKDETQRNGRRIESCCLLVAFFVVAFRSNASDFHKTITGIEKGSAKVFRQLD